MKAARTALLLCSSLLFAVVVKADSYTLVPGAPVWNVTASGWYVTGDALGADMNGPKEYFTMNFLFTVGSQSGFLVPIMSGTETASGFLGAYSQSFSPFALGGFPDAFNIFNVIGVGGVEADFALTPWPNSIGATQGPNGTWFTKQWAMKNPPVISSAFTWAFCGYTYNDGTTSITYPPCAWGGPVTQTATRVHGHNPFALQPAGVGGTAVPEPSVLALILCGLGMAAFAAFPCDRKQGRLAGH